ncbi:MAG: bifunctional precorrin-2 dehydrogenase/sirohydrochlorin ferrochelatase [Deltaproteobacteria bacterium]|nr:bifunctional precorrin-2 dehydrogenase/sirohydrochlorin ferrochelatase [Deltaproteobacteria bacterium]
MTSTISSWRRVLSWVPPSRAHPFRSAGRPTLATRRNNPPLVKNQGVLYTNPMRYFPINLDLQGKPVLVIGSGQVAEKKGQGFLKAGAKLRRLEAYQPGCLESVFLAVVVTDDQEIHQKIRKEAQEKRVLLNIVDHPDLCDFTFVSRLQRGEFMITVSTGGGSPALAKKVREALENQYGPEYETMTKIMSALRRPVQNQWGDRSEGLFKEFVHSPVLGWIRAGEKDKIDQLLGRLFGEGYSLERLGIQLGE